MADNRSAEEVPVGIRRLNVEGGTVNMELTVPPPVIYAMAKAMVEMLGEAPNYVEAKVLLHSEDHHRFAMTIQRCEGKTPNDRRLEAEARAEKLTAALRYCAAEAVERGVLNKSRNFYLTGLDNIIQVIDEVLPDDE